jgi:hypothetical protein
VIIDLGGGGDGTAPTLLAAPLVNAYRGRQAVDQIDIRPLQLMKKLSRIYAKALNVLALPFRVQSVKSQGTLSGPAGARQHDKLIAGYVDVQVL